MPANVIDSKVVEMKFDNSKFEKNVKDTMSTLDKLKLSLAKLTGKSTSLNIDTSDSNKGIQALGNSVESVASKFNALEAVAFGALAKIGSQAVVAGEQLLKSLTVDQISSGYAKYDEKTSSVQTLVNSTGKSVEEINKYLDQLMWYSDETSYSFTEMTAALAQMTSTGGDIDKLIPTITGIANATAYAGKNGEAFVHTIRNLTQSYNAGYLQLMDWKSLNLAGTSSKQLTEQLIKAAEELGTVQKGMLTVENFAEKLKNKDITTEVMDLAFSRFSAMSQEAYKLVSAGKFETASEAIEAIADDFDELAQRAFKSAQEAKSFTEAIDATKDAVSSGWMNTFEIIFGNYEQAKELWTDLANGMWDFFAGGSEDRNNLLADVLGDNWDRITTRIEEAGIKTEDFERQMEIVASRAGLNTDTIIDYYGSMGEWLKQTGEKNSHFITETLYDMAYATKEIGDEFKITEKQLKSFDDIIEKMSKGKIKNSTTALKELEKAGFKTAETQKMVNEFYETGGKNILKLQYDSDKLKESMIELSKSQVSYYDYSEEQISILKDLATESNTAGTALNELKNRIGKEKENGRDLLFDAIGDSLMSLVDIIDIVKQAFSEIFPQQTAGMIYSIINRIREAAKSMRDFLENENNAEKLTRVFKGLFAVLDIIKTIVGGALNVGFSVFKAILEELGFTVFDLTADISDNIVSFRDWLKEHIKTKDIIDKLVPKVKTFVKTIKNWFEEGGKLNKVLKTTKELLLKVKNAISEWFKEFGESDNKVEFLIETLADGLEKGIPKLVETAKNVIKEFINAISDYFSGDGEDDMAAQGETAVAAFVNGFSKGMQPFKDIITDFGNDVIEKIKKLPWERIFAVAWALAVVSLLAKLSKWASALQAILDPLGALITKVGNIAGSFSKLLTNIGRSLQKEATGDLILKLAIAVGILALSVKLLEDTDPENALKGVLVIGVLLAALVVSVNLISKSIAAITALDPIKSVAVIFSFVALIDAIIVAMTAMVALIYIGSKIENAKQGIGVFIISLVAIVVLVGMVAALAPYIETAKEGLKSTALFMVALGATMLLIAYAIKTVSEVPEDAIWRSVGIVGLIGLFVLLFYAAITQITTKSTTGIYAFGETMLKIAGSMILAAIALKIIGTMDEQALNRGIVFFSVFFAFTAILMLAAAKSKKLAANLATFGTMCIALGASMILMAIALKIIGTLDKSELAKASAFLGEFITFIGLLALVTRKASTTVKEFAAVMLALGAALILMTISVKILSRMKAGEIAKGTIAVIFLGITLAVMVQAFRGFQDEAPKIAKSLIAAGICILLMAAAVFLLGQLKVETLAKGLIAIAFLSTFMAGLIFATKFANTDDILKNLIGLAVCIAVLAGALAIVSLIPLEKLGPSVAALTVVMVALGALLYAAGVATIGFNKNTIAAFGLIALLIAEIGVVLYLLAIIPNPLGVLEAALGIGIVLAAMIGSLFVLSKMDTISPKALLSLAAMSVILLMIAGIFYIMNLLKVEVGLKQAIALSLVLVALAAALKIVAPLGKFGPKIFLAVAALSALVLGIGAALELLGLGLIGLMEKAGPALIVFGASLSAFFMSIMPFLEYLKQDDIQKAVDGVSKLTEALLMLTAAEILDCFTKFKGTNTADFASKLTDLSGPLAKFVDDIKLLSKDDVEKASIAGEVLKTIIEVANNLPKKGGVKGFILGNSNFSKFIEDMGNLGPSLVKFGYNVRGINAKEMEKAIGVAKLVSELANSLPTVGGKLQKWLGENVSLSTFSSQLGYFGNGIAAFSNAVSPSSTSKGVNKYYMDQGVNAGKKLADLANSLPEVGGTIKSWFDGETLDMQTFGTQIQAFGNALVTFSTRCTDIDKDGLTAGIDGASQLVDMAIKLGNVEIGSEIFGSKVATLETLAEDLWPLGDALNLFYGSVKDIDSVSLDLVLPVLHKLVDIFKTTNELDTNKINSFTTGIYKLASLNNKDGNVISKAAKTLQTAANDVKGIDSYAFDKFITCLRDVTTVSSDFAGTELTNFGLLAAYLNEFASYLPSIVSSVNGEDFDVDKLDMVISRVSTIGTILRTLNTSEYENVSSAVMAMNELANLNLKDIISAFSVEGTTGTIDEGISPLMTTLATGIINGIDLVKGAFEQLFTTLLEYIPTKAFDFNTAAFHLMDSQHGGFSAGISKSKDTILYELKRIISSVVVEVKNDKYQDFYDMGNYFVKGLAAGIRENAILAYNASKELANGVKTATQTGLQEKSPSKIARLFGQYWDEGLMLGIKDYEGQVYDTATHLSESTITGFKTAIDGIYDVIDWDMYPVITPTIDLSYVEAGTARINKLFENKKLKAEAEVQNGVNPAKDQPTYNFTQNNYSPKALSRIEIYRQTNNLISAARGR